MAERPPIKGEILESLSKALSESISHAEIDKYLQECSLTVSPMDLPKWKRIFNSFAEYQNRLRMSNAIRIFIQKVASPVRFINDEAGYEAFRISLNKCLLFLGLELLQNGKYRVVETVSTISEAHRKADNLALKLRERAVHPEVLRFCKAELVQDNYFHAVFECTKSIAEKIRTMSGTEKDGSELVDVAFGLGKSGTPILALNSLQTESEQSEHKGFMNLIKGLFGMFRNTTAHAPRIVWHLEEEDALDCLTIASLAHRKLAQCRVNLN